MPNFNLTKIVSTPPAAPATSDTDITKDDLVDQVILFSVRRYNPEAESKFGNGTQHETDLDLLIVTGPRKGQTFDGWRCWGNLARNAGQAVPEGHTGIARVIHNTDNPQRPWYGLEFDVDDKLKKQAVALAAANSIEDSEDTPF